VMMHFRFPIFEYRWGAAIAVACLSLVSPGRAAEATQDVLVVVGASGEPDYATGFSAAAEAWRQACAAGGATCMVIGDEDPDAELPADDGTEDRNRLQTWIDTATPTGPRPLWIVFLGHGTFDGREARLNLRGPDVTATEFAAWLAPIQRPLVVVLGNSASGPFLPLLSGSGRVVITATTTGDEVNYARFGERFAEAIGDPAADLDQDGQTSVLEAFLSANRRVQDFYVEELRLATEHALLDDNGDHHGTPPEWFRGTRATKQAEGGASADGTNAHRIALIESPAERALTSVQKAERNRLEDQLEQLRQRKDAMAPADYERELERVLRTIGTIYRSAEAATAASTPAPAAPATPTPTPPPAPENGRAPDS